MFRILFIILSIKSAIICLDTFGYLPIDQEISKPQLPEVKLNTVGTPLKIIGVNIVKFYQKFISPHRTGGHCPMNPTCSNFGKQALKKYGPFWGTLMIIDRIYYRENESIIHFYPLINIRGEYRYYDPIEANYIFSEKKIKYYK